MRKKLTVGSLIPGRPMHTVNPSAHSPVEQTVVPARALAKSPQRHALSSSTENKTVRLKQQDQEFRIRFASCQTLLQAAQEQGQPLAYKCQQGHCGKCTVQLMAGSTLLASPTHQEQEKLGRKLAQGYRLACQSTFHT